MKYNAKTIYFVDEKGDKQVGVINYKLDGETVAIIYGSPKMGEDDPEAPEYRLSELELLRRLAEDSDNWHIIGD